MTIHVGYTGTRHGMSVPQARHVGDILSSLAPAGIIAHHGDCEGGDAEFHVECRVQHATSIIIHPGPVGDVHRAHCLADVTLPPMPHMRRNRAIVDISAIMIGAPFEDEPQDRGGTWATIRMARRALKRGTLTTLYVVGRSGDLLDHGAWPWR